METPTDPVAHLKGRLFALTTRGALLRVAAAVGLGGMEDRHTYAIINAIRELPSVDLAVVLEQLSDIELKLLANDLGLGGAARPERLARLLAFAAGAPRASEAAAPARAPVPTGASTSTATGTTTSTATGSDPNTGALTPTPTPTSTLTSTDTGTPRPPQVHPGPSAAALSAPVSPPAPPVARARFDDEFSLAPPSSRAPRSRRGPSRLPGPPGETFVAIDFETADHGRDSACAVALVRVEQEKIARRVAWLIRPPRQHFIHSGVHGITWPMVVNQPTFAQLWPRLLPVLEGAAYLVAHNAPFDRSVLRACCAAAGFSEPALEFECTVQMARRLWNPPQCTLPALCQRFGIPLQHHDAASDAEACARLVIEARARR